MKKILVSGIVVILMAVLIAGFAITRDGKLVTPSGDGAVMIDVQRFEAFPLPDYAAKHVTSSYKSYLVEVEPGIKMHVLEVGTGIPVYMQHGNPTSGFLYRKIVENLPEDRARMIMPTLVGLGFSSKVPASEHTLDNHIRWTNALLEQLELTEVVFVGQDWGGPVGMGALAQSPEILRGAVILNTGLSAPTEKRDLSRAHATVKTPFVGELALEVLGSIFDSLSSVQGDPESIPPEIAALYGRPVTESGNSKAPLALMRMVPDAPEHPSATQMRMIESYVRSLQIPVELVWGMNDPILAAGLPVMIDLFPQARVTETDGGHFLQEEKVDEIAAAILRVVDQAQAFEGLEEPPSGADI